MTNRADALAAVLRQALKEGLMYAWKDELAKALRDYEAAEPKGERVRMRVVRKTGTRGRVEYWGDPDGYDGLNKGEEVAAFVEFVIPPRAEVPVVEGAVVQ